MHGRQNKTTTTTLTKKQHRYLPKSSLSSLWDFSVKVIEIESISRVMREKNFSQKILESVHPKDTYSNFLTKKNGRKQRKPPSPIQETDCRREGAHPHLSIITLHVDRFYPPIKIYGGDSLKIHQDSIVWLFTRDFITKEPIYWK